MVGDPDDDPASIGPIAMSVREPEPELAPARPRPIVKRIWLVLAIGLSVGAPVFGVLGFTRTMSMDIPLPNNVRLGFFGNQWPVRWTCPEGHDHWSLPYWFGTLSLALMTTLAWRAWARRRRSHNFSDTD